MPNLVAYAALLGWPFVTTALFRMLPAGRAVIATILSGYLLLPPPPAGLDLPLMPGLGKEQIPVITAFVAALILYRPGLRLLPGNPIVRIFIVLYLLSPLGTVLTNSEPLFYGPTILPGLGWREAGGAIIMQAITLMPLLLARHFLSRPEDRRDLLVALMIGGLVYSLPVLLEVRLSPQLNTWVYGYFQHSFEQMMRSGGFRPIVFLYHALWVAFYLMTAVLAAAALARSAPGNAAIRLWAALGWLILTLVLGKSYASIFYAAALVPVVLFLSVRMQLRLAALIAVIALVYPLARSAGLIPIDAIVSLAGEMGSDRAHTLQYRFDNESVLLLHAWEKPLFGWGMWGRNNLFSAESGKMLTVTDGRWVIVLGVLGFSGFIAEFGLLSLPVLAAWRHGGAIADSDGALWTGTLCLLLGVNLFDLIPNATLTPLTWLAAGGILAALEHMSLVSRSPATATSGPVPIRVVL